MIKNPLSVSAACSVLIALLCCPAALPADNTTQNPSSTAGQSSTNRQSFSLLRLPVYIAGVTTGAFVGMPINLVRRFVYEEKQGVQGMVGDSKNKAAIYSAGAFWLPFSAFLGASEAPILGPINSIRYCDRPFSKDQFSLGEIGDVNRDPG